MGVDVQLRSPRLASHDLAGSDREFAGADGSLVGSRIADGEKAKL
jgi:hypothetical protein